MNAKNCLYIALVFSAFTLPSFAQSSSHRSEHTKSTATAETKVDDKKAEVKKQEMVEAEVRKIDKDAKKITLKHGAIKSLDMTAMTMVFQVKDVKLLDTVKAGDKVKFSVEQTKSGYVVTSIEAAK